MPDGDQAAAPRQAGLTENAALRSPLVPARNPRQRENQRDRQRQHHQIDDQGQPPNP